MAHDSSPTTKQAPVRVFTRAMGVVLIAWLAASCLTPFVIERANDRHRTASALLAVANDQRAVVRQIIFGLDQLAQTPDGAQARPAKNALRWDVDRLLDLEVQRADLAPPGASGMGSLIEAAAAAVALAEGDGPHGDAARTLRELLGARLAPQAERLVTQSRAAAERRRTRAQVTVFGLGALQTLCIVALGLGVVGPARARLLAWVHASEQTEEENRFRLLHDPLTHLPNNAYLRAHLTRLAAGVERATTQTAVLRIDLDKFKTLRETLGTRTAEEMLRICARRLRQTLRAGDFAAYLGQDHFVVVAPELEDANAASGIAHRIQTAMTRPFSLQGGARRIGCTIGVTMLTDDLPEADRTLANAEIALSEAQDAGPGSIRYFREGLRREAERREKLFSELITGLEKGELVPYFQPQIDLETGGLSGFEALVRWRHPRQGLLNPAAFLEFAEQADLTERVGEAVLSHSLAALNAWDSAGLRVPRVGINFAMAQLRDPRLIEKIKWEVERNDIDPSRVSIEVLETVLIKSDTDLVVRNLRGLASVGFEIELDDFGTGHASIQNLRRFMVDRIKIDRSFIYGIEGSEEQQTLTASMIAMARALGIRTLAEGVETPEAEAVLRQLGCDHFQGYLVARPMSLADTFHWLAAFQGREPRAIEAGRPAAGDPNTT